MDFKGQTALVTGACGMIGKGIATLFAEHGANLALVDLNGDALDVVKEKLSVYGTKISVYTCDIRQEEQVREVAKQAVEHFGKIEILVNNAGIYDTASFFKDSTSDAWRKKLEVNVLGTMYFTHALLDQMLAQGYGRIINIGSVVAEYGLPRMVDYSTTKGAVVSFTKALAKEVAKDGITVNCVSPGSIHDDITRMPEHSYIGHAGSPLQCAAMVCFLASKEASYVSGQDVRVDGCRKKI